MAWTVELGGLALVVFVCMIALPGYLYSNGYIKIQKFNPFFSTFGINANLAADNPPDRRDWQIDKLVQKVGQHLNASKNAKKVIFLGGNRYYHIKLLDYEGFVAGFQLNYIALPYYSNPDMSVDESLDYIEKVAPSGIVFKSGENWPLFSSKLDLKIIEQLKKKSEYSLLDLNIEQPDGSSFYIFIRKDLTYTPVKSVFTIEGTWKVAGGLAYLSVDSMNILTIITETGLKGTALIRDGDIHIHNWNVSGKMTADMKYIYWSNGSVWSR